MFRRQDVLFALIGLAGIAGIATVVTAVVSAQDQGRAQQPARDTSAQRPTLEATEAKGRITGRVLAADTARPVKRARVFVNAAELPGGRGTLTDDAGVFDFAALPAGRYTLTVSKTGFVGLSYGQRRPLQAGTPLQLADGQEITGIDFRLPRGSVIAGHVFDESGDALPGANVRIMRYEYAQGNRQLVPVGTGQTDDQGAFRVWGLNPGDYYVTASTRNFDVGGRGAPLAAALVGGGGRGAAPLGGRGGVVRAVIDAALQARGGFAAAPADTEPVAYAPTFYPGVPSVNDARAVTLGLGAEVVDVNFGLLLVRTARVSGRVTSPDGSPTTSGNVNLLPDGQPGRGGQGQNFASRVQWDGSFAIGNVPPGRYILRARGDDTTVPQFAQQPLTINDGDLADLAVVLAPSASIKGTVTFQATQSQQIPATNQLRITAPPVDFANVGPNPNARVDGAGIFTLDGVPAGLHWIRTQGALRGWTLKSVVVNGRDVIDTPLELRSGQTLSGVSLVFSDKLSEVNGTITDDRGQPITEYTVLAFPADSSLRRPQARQIMTARPDQNGKFQIRGLPAGDYFLVPVDPAEQGEWFEPAFLDQHQNSAARFSLVDGDTKTQDFKLTVR